MSFNTTLPLTRCSEKMVQLILHEYSILALICGHLVLILFTLTASEIMTKPDMTWCAYDVRPVGRFLFHVILIIKFVSSCR